MQASSHRNGTFLLNSSNNLNKLRLKSRVQTVNSLTRFSVKMLGSKPLPAHIWVAFSFPRSVATTRNRASRAASLTCRTAEKHSKDSLTFSQSNILPHSPSLKSLLASSKTSVSLLLEGLSISSLFSGRSGEHSQQHAVVGRSSALQILTLHGVDELPVPAPQLPPLSWVIFAVLRVGRVEGKGSDLCLSLLLGSLRPVRAVLTGRALVAVRMASPHSALADRRLHAQRATVAYLSEDTCKNNKQTNKAFTHNLWVWRGTRPKRYTRLDSCPLICLFCFMRKRNKWQNKKKPGGEMIVILWHTDVSYLVRYYSFLMTSKPIHYMKRPLSTWLLKGNNKPQNSAFLTFWKRDEVTRLCKK